VLGTALLLSSIGVIGWYLDLPGRWLFYVFLGLFAIFVITMELLGRGQAILEGIPHEAV
jgi:hypothetical protein